MCSYMRREDPFHIAGQRPVVFGGQLDKGLEQIIAGPDVDPRIPHRHRLYFFPFAHCRIPLPWGCHTSADVRCPMTPNDYAPIEPDSGPRVDNDLIGGLSPVRPLEKVRAGYGCKASGAPRPDRPRRVRQFPSC